jgi:NTP pyrophosphatase (non-canonical NTP hydrolase)
MAVSMDDIKFILSPEDKAISEKCIQVVASSEEADRAMFESWRLIEERAHAESAARGWWTDINTGESLIGKRNVGEMLMLIVSEAAEAMEAHRKNKNDDKLPHRPGIEVEIADMIIRMGDLSRALRLDVAGALVEKMRFNRVREDHSIEARKAAGGKAY